ncbi:MAG: FHA domain-containing protein [Lachnospiraceae bacterium]|jgi:hypothetical protein|nr:FHA domain-containing protein [Lachnospiraceae bacterium]
MGGRVKGAGIIFRKAAALAMAVLFLLSGRVLAAVTVLPYIAEQAIGKAPNLKVYMTGSKIQKTSQVTGTIGDIAFAQDGDIATFRESGEAISYIVLMDNSGSVNEEQFGEAKRQLEELRKSLKENDAMALYTVGSDTPQGEKALVFGREVGAKDKKDKKTDCEAIQAIPYMNTPESVTVLYRSLNQILQEQASPKKRTVVLLITDGEDDSKGKDIDHVSTANTVKEASVPVYGIVLQAKPTSTGEYEEQDGKIEYTKNEILAAKNSRGYYCDCSVDAAPESVQNAFQTIQAILQDETYVLKLKAPTNQAAGKGSLSLTVDNNAVDAVTVDYTDYEEDKDAPEIAGAVEEAGSNSITFTLQDKNGVNLADVNELSNYSVQAAGEDGRVWAVDSVNAVAKGNGATVTLTVSEDFFNDDYTLRCSNIRDNSQDGNKMDAAAEFTVEKGLDANKAARREALQSYWWVGLVALVLIIGCAIIVVIRKKRVEVAGVNPDELQKPESREIRLTITDRKGTIKNVEWIVEGSLFIGRSDICNIYFDDDRLSKQHFVIETNKMGCYIEDLESLNGTFVNGVKLTNRRMLLDGDIITAGREKFVFHMPRQQPAGNGGE